MAQTLVYKHVAMAPAEALHVKGYTFSECKLNEVVVKLLVAPISPLDLAVLRGKYPDKPKNRVDGDFVPSNDAIGTVIECGKNVKDLQPGDVVSIT